MRRMTFWLTTAVVTFTVGVIAAAFWIHTHHSNVIESVKPEEINLQWTYINQDLKWESPPKEVTSESGDYKYSVNERILVFNPNGQYASISCTIYQSSGPQRMQLIPNDGFGVYKGTWTRNDDGTITIKSRLMSSNKMATPFIAEQEKERVERLIIHKIVDERIAGEVELNGRVFIPSPNIEGVNELVSWPNGHL